jgi:hypothetical protein
MSKVIETIEGNDVILEDDGRITYTAKAAIDADGSGPSLGDPDFQSDTSLHLGGKHSTRRRCATLLSRRLLLAL